jgi:hypothetical protein
MENISLARTSFTSQEMAIVLRALNVYKNALVDQTAANSAIDKLTQAAEQTSPTQLEVMVEQARDAVEALKTAREAERVMQRADRLFTKTGVSAQALTADARELRKKHYLNALDALHYASTIAKERLRVAMAEEVHAARETA